MQKSCIKNHLQIKKITVQSPCVLYFARSCGLHARSRGFVVVVFFLLFFFCFFFFFLFVCFFF